MNGNEAMKMDFFKAFLKHPTKVGAVIPSSKELAEAMIRGLNLEPGDSLLELGPGTGAFTRHIRHILPDADAYIGIEREPKFVQYLQKNFPDMNFVKGRAEHANELYEANDKSPAKVIISGIPFALLDAKVREEIIEMLKEMMVPGAIFRTFQYVHAYPLPLAVKFRKEMDDLFGKHKRSRIVFRNLPPAFVLTWKR